MFSRVFQSRTFPIVGASAIFGSALDRLTNQHSQKVNDEKETTCFSFFPKAFCHTSSNTNGKFGLHTYPANNPIEDRMLAGYHASSGWMYGAVFDGHGGWEVAEMASQSLPPLILEKLSKLSPEVYTKQHYIIDEIMIDAYQTIEKKWISSIEQSYTTGQGGYLNKIGSCSLLAFYKDSQLIIVNNGDCRAVLGSVTSSNSESVSTTSIPSTYTATILNRDHNCRVRLEQINLEENHPNETSLIVCKSSRACYVKGRLQLTRSLGDVYLKYPNFNSQLPLQRRTGGRFIPSPYTPPYVSHIPDIHYLTIQPEDK
jgi:pyruvate dehydrogenase phosphatase